MTDLLVIVPSRGRPDNLCRVLDAWDRTDAVHDAELLAAVDADDPQIDRYRTICAERAGCGLVSLYVSPSWRPMVNKLNDVAASESRHPYSALAFAGDDHLPRTPGWARAYLDALAELGTGIVYGNDLIQGERLPTQWAMTADIVRTLGRMVPADVEHLYCDNAVMALGLRAECLRYLPDVVVEHVHPAADKAPLDDGYRYVNRREQYRRDGLAYRQWARDGLEVDAAAVRRLREEVASV